MFDSYLGIDAPSVSIRIGFWVTVCGFAIGCQCVCLVRWQAAFAKPLLADGTANLRET